MWFLLIAIPAVAILVWYWYKNERSLSEMPKTALITAKILRTLSILLVLLLIFSPVFKWYKSQIKKPVIAIAVDQSQSVKYAKQFPKQENYIKQLIDRIKDNPSEEFDYKLIAFGESPRPFDSLAYHDKVTNISDVFDYIQNQYKFENLGAIILLSDGIYTHGQNPLYSPSAGICPVYSTILGDTNVTCDIFIEQVLYNPHAFTGNNIRIQAKVKANKMAGKKTKIALLENDKVIQSFDLNINKNEYFQTFGFIIASEKEGIHKYHVKINPVENESNLNNNVAYAVIHVSSEKQKIIIASAFPHPDIGALKTALESNPSLEISLLSPEKAADSLSAANAVILYQLPGKQNNASLLIKNILAKKIPTLFILGGQSNLNQLNALMPNPIVLSKANQFDDAYLNLNKSENLFNLGAENEEIIESYPPLMVAFGDYKLNANAEVVAYQKIKQIQTSKPLIAFDSWQDNQKFGIIFGEGLYRWRLAEYAQKQESQAFNELMNKLVIYLLANQKKERFKVKKQAIFNEYDNISFEAEVYNKSYEPIDNAEVKLSLTSQKKETYHFVFDKNNPFYSLNAGKIPAGEYQWNATATINNEKLTKSGLIVVREENIESSNLLTNTDMMEQLAIRSNGKVLPPDSLSLIDQILKRNPNIISVSYTEEDFTSLIDVKWLLILIVVFIGTEWFLRRFYGSL